MTKRKPPASDSKRMPTYPIYIPSKGRADRSLTANFMLKDGVTFRIVVEPQEQDLYAERFGAACLLVLPKNDQGLIYARNWIKAHATAEGHVRHWQIDDNIARIRRWWYGDRIPVASGAALSITEEFVDRYENVAVAGLNYYMFAVESKVRPFFRNSRVYSCSLILNALPHRWRSVYNDDTDFCLQVLADGWCTILMNIFLIEKRPSMTVRGGNTDALYKGDGRAKMARSLERLWPGVVTTHRRFSRPQHHVFGVWDRFDTPLVLKPGLKLKQGIDEHGLSLVHPVTGKRLKPRRNRPYGQNDTL